MAPPFRADQIGSLIRPNELLDQRNSSSSTPEKLKEVQEKCIAQVVKEQQSRDIRPIVSGEFERFIFYSGFFDIVTGFETRNQPLSTYRPDFPTALFAENFGIKERPVSIATSKIKHKREQSVYLKDWLYLKSQVKPEQVKECKVTIPSPTWFQTALRDGGAYSPGVYDNDDEYYTDVVAALQTEIMALYDAGLRNIAVDDPHLSYYADINWTKTYPEHLKQPENAGLKTLEELFDQHISVHNALLRGLPGDLTIGVHVCRGNFPQGQFSSTGSYESIAEKLFNELDYKLFYLEFDSPRAGTLESLRFLPRGKAVVLGLVTTKHAELEDFNELKGKVLQAADIIAATHGTSRDEALRDCLAVSPQCGFSSAVIGYGKGFTEEVQWKKLELLRDLAKDIWGSG